MAITKLNNTTEILRSEATLENLLITEAQNQLSPLVIDLYEEFDRDTVNLKSFLRRGCRKDIYGRIPAIINKIVSLYTTPIIDGPWDPERELEEQDDIIAFFNDKGYPITHDMLLDIKEFKGYTSFVSDEGELINGVEPNYEALKDSYIIISEALNLPALDFKLTPTIYNKAEQSALSKAQNELKVIQEMKAKSKALEEA